MTDAEPLTRAHRRLAVEKKLEPASLSHRLEGAPAIALQWGSTQCQLRLDAPTADEPWALLHAAIYRVRPDAGAIVVAKPHWASALRLAGDALPGLFDEQVRQLGPRVERLEHLAALASRHNAFLWGDGVLCLGVTLDRAVFNLELLDKCAHAYVLAAATGRPVTRVPWLVQRIAFTRLKKDQSRSATAWARGVPPTGFTAY